MPSCGLCTYLLGLNNRRRGSALGIRSRVAAVLVALEVLSQLLREASDKLLLLVRQSLLVIVILDEEGEVQCFSSSRRTEMI